MNAYDEVYSHAQRGILGEDVLCCPGNGKDSANTNKLHCLVSVCPPGFIHVPQKALLVELGQLTPRANGRRDSHFVRQEKSERGTVMKNRRRLD